MSNTVKHIFTQIQKALVTVKIQKKMLSLKFIHIGMLNVIKVTVHNKI